MKKILSFLIVLVATATASAQYNTELLADPGFESAQTANTTWETYYWSIDGIKVHAELVSDVSADPYYDSSAQVADGSYSVSILPPFDYSTDGFTVNVGRNDDDWNGFTGVNVSNLSYNAGDSIEASLDVYIDSWDNTSGGVGFRIVGNGSILSTSSFVSSPAGGWQTVNLSHEFTSAFTGELRYDVRYDHDGNGGQLAYVDNASMQVIPEASSLILTFGAMMLTGLGIFWRRR